MMERLRGWLHNTMKMKRLSAVTLMNVHRNHKINYNDAVRTTL